MEIYRTEQEVGAFDWLIFLPLWRLSFSDQTYIIRDNVFETVHVQKLRIGSNRQELAVRAETRCPDGQRIRAFVYHVELREIYLILHA